MQNKLFYIIPLVLATFLCGCSDPSRPDNLPTLYPVTLTIMLDGQPLEGAMVVLYAEDPAIENWTVGGYTDAQGKAIIVTHSQFRGAPAGKFKVCVSKEELPDESTLEEEMMLATYTAAPSTGTMRTIIHHVAPLFGQRETTTLAVEVPVSRKTLEVTLNVSKP